MRKFKNDRKLMPEVVVHATTTAIINQQHEITADQEFMQKSYMNGLRKAN